MNTFLFGPFRVCLTCWVREQRGKRPRPRLPCHRSLADYLARLARARVCVCALACLLARSLGVALELEPDICPLDLEPEWTRLLKYFCEKKKRRKTPDWYECRLTVRARPWVPVPVLRAIDDPAVIRILFAEAVYSVIETKFFNFTIDKQVQLAAYHLQALDLNYNKKVHKKDTLAARAKTFFSRSTMRLMNKADLADALLSAYKKLKNTTSVEAMMAYLDLLYDEPLYGAVFFEAIIKDSPSFRPNECCIMALTASAVLFTHGPSNSADTMQLAFHVPYEDVISWDYEETTFTITIMTAVGLVTQRMYTKKGALIIDLIERGTALSQSQIVGPPPPQGML